MEDKAVTLFREYVCLKTLQPDPDYGLLYLVFFKISFHYCKT